MNPALAPRKLSCVICKRVAAIEDVNVRLFDEDGKRLRPLAARSYLRSIGYPGAERTLDQALRSHANHVEKSLADPRPTAPIDHPGDGEITRIEPLTEPERSRWMDVNQAGMDIGMDALRSLNARLATGDLDPKEEIALAKLGLTAANKRADLAARGAERDPLDALMRLAAGVKPDGP